MGEVSLYIHVRNGVWNNHIGRAQYKHVHTPVLIWDAPQNVTFFRRRVERLESVGPRLEIFRGDGLSGRVTTRAEDAQGTSAQSHASPSILL